MWKKHKYISVLTSEVKGIILPEDIGEVIKENMSFVQGIDCKTW
jgi:hypothetical protein